MQNSISIIHVVKIHVFHHITTRISKGQRTSRYKKCTRLVFVLCGTHTDSIAKQTTNDTNTIWCRNIIFFDRYSRACISIFLVNYTYVKQYICKSSIFNHVLRIPKFCYKVNSTSKVHYFIRSPSFMSILHTLARK